MKKIIYYFILITAFAACTPKDNAPDEKLVILPVAEVTFPTTFEENVVSEIPIKFALPNGCHRFYDFYYLKSDNTRTVAIVAVNSNQEVCSQNVTIATQILKFKPALAGTYTFKFYKGQDAAGADEFFEYEAVVN